MQSPPRVLSFCAHPDDAEFRVAGTQAATDFAIDVRSVVDVKEQMLVRHTSRRNWIRDHHHADDYVLNLRERDAAMGARAGVPAAEGFTQHLGPGYPHDDPLGDALRDKIRKLE